jgi:predicted nucleic acid-binding protein
MIVLDSNVISELMRREPDQRVLGWIRRQNTAQLYLTALSAAEIRRGIALLPDGKRKRDLEQSFEDFLAKGFEQRILPFTTETSRVYAPIYRARVKAGLGVGELDLLIAAIAKQYQADLATRNLSDFEGCGIRIINPWK